MKDRIPGLCTRRRRADRDRSRRSEHVRSHGPEHHTRDRYESRVRRSERREHPRIGSARGTTPHPRGQHDGGASSRAHGVRNESRRLRRDRARAESSTQSLCRVRRRRQWRLTRYLEHPLQIGFSELRPIVHRPTVNRRVQSPAESSRRAPNLLKWNAAADRASWSHDWSPESCPSPTRIEEGAREPPNMATETKTPDRSNLMANRPSPVPMREPRIAKTQRNRVFFSVERFRDAGSLRSARLNGGGGSRGGTRLSWQFPDEQGKYREFLRVRAPRSSALPEFPRRSEQLETNSLQTRTGNYFRRAGNPWSETGNRNSLLPVTIWVSSAAIRRPGSETCSERFPGGLRLGEPNLTPPDE